MIGPAFVIGLPMTTASLNDTNSVCGEVQRVPKARRELYIWPISRSHSIGAPGARGPHPWKQVPEEPFRDGRARH